ncbi:dipeptidase PepV [Bacillus sp. FJAT-49732]|uniref:Dipeptidase PepV n=1 Tax=Lederbergia citrisecunda TaxID=2833583 RepID=A0A942YL70_9BACI|nr:dipeptidase PepV [Lederbergia citrisecunda]MBS4200059.1 dipeptidase PepV [Lederbergia citrisecunda]
MGSINWIKEVEKRKDDLISDLQGLLKIESVLDEENTSKEAPLGENVRKALDYMLELGEKDGFVSKNSGNVAGHLEMGTGEQLIGVLGHVDVVPAGDGWSVNPFEGVVQDGKIFARGAIDDKGPTMAAYYAMKIIKDLKLPLEKRVRLIIGTDEESKWRCVDHYFQHEEMPVMGFAPDADFPIINAEKGIADFDLVQNVQEQNEQAATITLLSFVSGLRYNMVPDKAKAVLDVKENHTELMQMFNDFLSSQDLQGQYYVESGYSIIELEGVSAHGSEPDKGRNAGLLLASFLSTVDLDNKGMTFVSSAVAFFFGDSRGRNLGVQYKDKISGELTINVGIMSYNEQEGGKFGLTMRYPVTFKWKEGLETLTKSVEEKGFSVANHTNAEPHHVSEDSELIQVLKNVYEMQTHQPASLMAIGGGTYARSLKSGVAFGALFPGRPDVAHQKDEYMELDDLVKATAIYAQAIYELAHEK